MIHWLEVTAYPVGNPLTSSHGCYDNDAEGVLKGGPTIVAVSSGSSWGNQVRSLERLRVYSGWTFSGTFAVLSAKDAHPERL